MKQSFVKIPGTILEYWSNFEDLVFQMKKKNLHWPTHEYKDEEIQTMLKLGKGILRRSTKNGFDRNVSIYPTTSSRAGCDSTWVFKQGKFEFRLFLLSDWLLFQG